MFWIKNKKQMYTPSLPSFTNGFVNDNDNFCISGVFDWDFNLVAPKVFVTCVPQLTLNTLFVCLFFCFFFCFFF